MYDLLCMNGDIVFLSENNVGMSITNAAETVVKEINFQYPGRRIVYKDTMDQWDELVHNDGIFVGFKNYVGYTPTC